MQSFIEVVMDAQNFELDPELGVFRYKFGSYELDLEPLTFGQIHLALYHTRAASGYPELMWTEKLPIQPGYNIPHGPGEEDDQPPARRKAIRAWLESMIAEIDKADARLRES